MKNLELAKILISPDATIKKAMKTLNATAERILFVVNVERVLIGTITDGDIRRGLIKGCTFNDPVVKIMHRKFYAVRDNMREKTDQLRKIMIDKEIEQIPVVDDRGRIVELIIWTDIFGNKKKNLKKKMMSNQIVIMAGGRGSRLDPFTKILPKPLIPIDEKSVIEIIMDKFYQSGFRKFILTLNYKKEYIKLFIKENKFPYLIDWVEENEPTGTAGSLALLAGKIRKPFFVTNCDILVDVDYRDVLDWHTSHGNMMTLIGCHKEVEIPYGVLEMDGGRLKRFVEKPNYDIIINTGVYLLEPEALKLISKGKPMDMNHLIEKISKSGKVSVYPMHQGWFDLGQWEEYKKSTKHLSGRADNEEI